jgi:bifunctional non-homologous end joining protein LigD
MVLHFQPIPLGRRPRPFSHPDWLFEIKWDGFRSLVHFEHGRSRLISRNGNEFKSFSVLNTAIATEIKTPVVLDGEIVCLGDDGKPQFRDLMFHRGQPRFVAFDLLWCNREDLRYQPLIDRKHRLRSVLPQRSERLLYCDHVEHDGEDLFQLVCQHDLEGIVAKPKHSPYLPEHSNWVKIRNRNYSQWVGREKLFERERGGDPDFHIWEECTRACETELTI